MERIDKAFKKVMKASIGWAVVMILLGLLAMIISLSSGVAVSILVAWIVVFTGLAHLGSAFTGRTAGAFIWRMLIGVVYLVVGGYLALHPQLALESVTELIGFIFGLEGVLEIASSFQFRVYSGVGWILLDGLVSLLLAFVIWIPWRDGSLWAVAMILGMNIMSSGISQLMYSLAARRNLEALSS